MRILALIDVLSFEPAGGAGTVLLQTGRALAHRGHEVYVACRRRTDLPERGDVLGMHFATYEASPRRPWAVWSRGKRLTRRILEEVRPEVVWSHHALPALWALHGSLATPCVYTFHSPWHEEYFTRMIHAPGPIARTAAAVRRRWEQKAVLGSATVTVLSKAMGEKLVEVHGPQRRVKVIAGGVDLDRFRPHADLAEERRKLRVDANAFLVATVRSLIPRVGIDRLMEAFVQVTQELPQARLLIGGDGPLRASLEAQAASLGVGDRVRFLGFVPDAQLPALLGAADLVVMPSQELEGFGLVAVEALACGTPVIATPVGGLPEVIGPLDPSWLVKDRTPAAIAEGMLARASGGVNVDLRQRCRRYAEEGFSWDRVAADMENAMNEARGFPL